MPQGIKQSNMYANEFPNFDETPKAVIAAIAMALSLRLSEDNFDDASDLIRSEWVNLHSAGIVPQKPARE